MKLSEYLEKNNLSKLQFAKYSKISRPSIQKYVSGEKPPAKIAAKIYKATRGAVTFKDLGYDH